MKFLLVRNAAIAAAILMATTASSEPRTKHRTAPVPQMTTQPAHESIDDSVTKADAMLMFVSGAGILALQLRRKQKGLRKMRLTAPTT